MTGSDRTRNLTPPSSLRKHRPMLFGALVARLTITLLPVVMGPGSALRLAGTTLCFGYQPKFLNNNSSAVFANSCIFPCRSLLPVSSVVTSAAGPATAMQLWPAASP
jgi:hypothetical protein